MNINEIYHAWKENRRRIEPGPDFTDQVINKIVQYEREKRNTRFDLRSWGDFFISYFPVKAALVAGGTLAGLIRVVVVLRILLGCASVAGFH